jgi:hypothetical protein
MIACWIGVRVPGCARRATAVASAPSLAGSVGACTAHDALDAASATPVAIHRRLLLDTVMVHPFEEGMPAAGAAGGANLAGARVALDVIACRHDDTVTDADLPPGERCRTVPSAELAWARRSSP